MLSDMENNLQWPKMKLCEYFGSSNSDHVEGICGHTNKQTDRQFVYYNKMQKTGSWNALHIKANLHHCALLSQTETHVTLSVKLGLRNKCSKLKF